MLNNREAVGNPNFQWQEYAFGRGKTRRKTIGFGKYDKKHRTWSDFSINLRELSIVDAGLGCAVWDAAIILSRWIHANQTFWAGKTVLELGSGVGLCGVVAARYAQKVYLTDYLEPVLDNLRYNVSINSNMDDETEDDYEGLTDEQKEARMAERRKFAEKVKTCQVAYLNWDEVSDDNPGTKDEIGLADVIIGSELTYSPKSVDGLIKTVLRYLKPEGVFYELLSTDRDGVPVFLERIKEAGLETVIHDIPEAYLGNYQTNQRPETYKFYTFRRSTTIYPDCK